MKPKPQILIVDDDADDREMVRDAFTSIREDVAYTLLENGDRLIDFLEHSPATEPPVLILLDLNMPGKDGRQTLKGIKDDDRFKSIPTVIFTTSASCRDRTMSYDLGANLFVSKPSTYHKLVELAGAIAKLWL